MKDIVLLGGPNGAGKTTAARVVIPESLGIREFLNADEFARSIDPENVERVAWAAGRLMLEKVRDLVGRRESFGLETTCAGKSYLNLLRNMKVKGWRITLVYFWLKSPSLAVARVAHRVKEGGHAVPPDVVRRRYYSSIVNMRTLYLPLADEVEIYDNSGWRRTLIATRREGGILVIRDSRCWEKIKRTRNEKNDVDGPAQGDSGRA
jgi:predicted ABC-type ATPase